MQRSNHLSGNPDSRRRRLRRVWVPFVFAVVVLTIASEHIPLLKNAKDKVMHSHAYQARKACQAAALAAAQRPAYARIVAAGEVHATQAAHYVAGVRVGEMGPTGAEATFDFNCYIDVGGAVAKTHKQMTPPAAD